MTKIKICGLRRPEDIEMINKYKPDYAGFVFAPSKRQVTKEEAKVLIDSLSEGIRSVGIFVDMPIEELLEIKRYTGLDIVQLHGNEDLEYCSKVEGTMWKAFRVKDESIKEELEKFKEYAEILLLDAYVKGVAGGTGTRFNWDLAADLSRDYDIALAGGIMIDNVIEGIEKVRPKVVDISSGVEKDGFKDEVMIKEIIKKIKF